MNILIINGHDYSRYIQKSGYGWSREDLDSDKTTRTKDGRMRRYKITTKRKLSYTLMNMTREQLVQLDDDLNEATFQATYWDLHGTMTKEFYCSSFAANMDMALDDKNEIWSGASFTMIEV